MIYNGVFFFFGFFFGGGGFRGFFFSNFYFILNFLDVDIGVAHAWRFGC